MITFSFQVLRKDLDGRQQPSQFVSEPSEVGRRELVVRRYRVSLPRSHRLALRRKTRLAGAVQSAAQDRLR